MKFTEAKLEQAFIELLENENFPHSLGNTISRADDEVQVVGQNPAGFLLL